MRYPTAISGFSIRFILRLEKLMTSVSFTHHSRISFSIELVRRNTTWIGKYGVHVFPFTVFVPYLRGCSVVRDPLKRSKE